MCGKGRPEVVGERRQDRKNHFVEVLLGLRFLVFVERVVVEDVNAYRFQSWEQSVQTIACVVHQLQSGLANGTKLLSGCQSVNGKFDDACFDLLFEARHAHHKKFSEVRADNREKLDTLQQRIAFILRFFQHAAEKSQLRQFAVEKEFGVLRDWKCRRRHRANTTRILLFWHRASARRIILEVAGCVKQLIGV